jgi:hypothetical protein
MTRMVWRIGMDATRRNIPSCPRVSRGFEDHVSEPANARRDAARRDGRGRRRAVGVVGDA